MAKHLRKSIFQEKQQFFSFMLQDIEAGKTNPLNFPPIIYDKTFKFRTDITNVLYQPSCGVDMIDSYVNRLQRFMVDDTTDDGVDWDPEDYTSLENNLESALYMDILLTFDHTRKMNVPQERNSPYPRLQLWIADFMRGYEYEGFLREVADLMEDVIDETRLVYPQYRKRPIEVGPEAEQVREDIEDSDVIEPVRLPVFGTLAVAIDNGLYGRRKTRAPQQSLQWAPCPLDYGTTSRNENHSFALRRLALNTKGFTLISPLGLVFRVRHFMGSFDLTRIPQEYLICACEQHASSNSKRRIAASRYVNMYTYEYHQGELYIHVFCDHLLNYAHQHSAGYRALESRRIACPGCNGHVYTRGRICHCEEVWCSNCHFTYYVGREQEGRPTLYDTCCLCYDGEDFNFWAPFGYVYRNLTNPKMLLRLVRHTTGLQRLTYKQGIKRVVDLMEECLADLEPEIQRSMCLKCALESKSLVYYSIIGKMYADRTPYTDPATHEITKFLTERGCACVNPWRTVKPQMFKSLLVSKEDRKQAEIMFHKANEIVDIVHPLAQKVDRLASVLERNQFAEKTTTITNSIEYIVEMVKGVINKFALDNKMTINLPLASYIRLATLLGELFTDDTPFTFRRIFLYFIRFFSEFNFTEIVERLYTFLTSEALPMLTQTGKKLASALFNKAGAPQQPYAPEPDVRDVHPQSADDIMYTIYVSLTGLIKAFLGVETNTPLIKAILFKHRFMGALRSIPFAEATVKRVTTIITELLPEFLQEYLDNSDETFWKREANGGDLERFVLAIRIARQAIMSGDKPDKAIWNRARDLKAAIEDKILKHPKLPPAYSNVFKRACDDLEHFQSNTEYRRYAPFVVYLHGGAGVGKSTLALTIATYMICKDQNIDLNELHTLKGLMKHVYTRSPTSEYWDGYVGQKIVVYDDFAQERKEELDIGEMIQIVTEAQYVLNMASIVDLGQGKKGDTFCSPFIIVCSNTAYPQPNSIKEADALYRRRHLMVEMKSRTEFEITNPFQHTGLKAGHTPTWYGNRIGEKGNLDNLITWMDNAYEAYLNSAEEVILQRANIVTQMVGRPLTEAQVRTITQDIQVRREEWLAQHMERAHVIQPMRAVQPQYGNQSGVMDLLINVLSNTAYPLKFALNTLTGLGLPLIYIRDFETLTPLQTVFGGILSALAVYKMVMSWFNAFSGASVNGQMSGSYETMKAPRVQTRVAPMRMVRGQGQTFDQLNATEIYEIWNETKKCRQQCLPIEGRVIAINAHFLDQCDDDDEMRIYSLTRGIDFTFKYNNRKALYIDHDDKTQHILQEATVISHPGMTVHNDLAFYELEGRVPPCKSIVNRIIKEDDLSALNKGYLTLLLSRDGQRETKMMPFYADKKPTRFTEGGKLYCVKDYLTYTGILHEGDCGAPLFYSSGGALPRTIMGIHFAASGENMGHGMFLTQELVKDALAMYKVQVQPPIEEAIQLEEPDDFVREATANMQWTVKGIARTCEGVRNVTKTSIRKSPLYEYDGPAMTQPAILSPRDPRLEGKPFDPILNGVKKYARQLPEFNREDIREGIGALKDMIMEARARIHPVETRVLPDHININGDPRLPFIQGLDMSTSAGHPYKKKNLTRKQLFSGEPGAKVIANELLRERFEKRVAEARKGRKIESYWVDTAKDERVKNKKITTPKTRVFTNAPLDFLMAGRKFFTGFNAFLNQLRSRIFSAVGTNPYSDEWDEMFRYLAEVGTKNALDVDINLFDGTVDPEFHEAYVEVANWYYNEFKEVEEETEDDVARRVLNDEIIHTPCLMSIYDRRTGKYYTVCYEVHTGEPSGVFDTANRNSVINFLYFFLTWMYLARRFCPDKANKEAFLEFVRLKTYGDDAVVSVHESCPWYNINTIVQATREMGLSVTNATKELGVQSDYKPLYQCQFLKNMSAYLNGKMVAQLERDVIREMLYWYKESDFEDVEGCVQQIVTASTQFLYFYGPDEYNRTCKKLQEKCYTENLHIVIPTWTSLDLKYRKGRGFMLSSASHMVTHDAEQYRIVRTVHNQNE